MSSFRQSVFLSSLTHALPDENSDSVDGHVCKNISDASDLLGGFSGRENVFLQGFSTKDESGELEVTRRGGSSASLQSSS